MPEPDVSRITVFATDYDRTLTDDSLTPVPEALAALAEAKKLGLHVVVVSGRDAPFLEREVGHLADVLVAENGCLVARPGEPFARTGPTPVDVREVLKGLEVELDQGEIIASYANADEHLVLPRLHGHAVQLIRNQDRTMILPEGIDKASGLLHALRMLGADPAETAAAGDGENDVPMLSLVAHGIAVANAVEELKEHATTVTKNPGGLGVAEWIRGVWMPAQGASG